MTEADQGTSPLVIRLFGALEVQQDGRSLRPLRSRKGEWLLTLLVLHHDRAVERDWLAPAAVRFAAKAPGARSPSPTAPRSKALLPRPRLWPESSEQQVAYNLRRNLTDLRQALGPDAARLQSPTFRTLRLDLAGADGGQRFFSSGAGGDRLVSGRPGWREALLSGEPSRLEEDRSAARHRGMPGRFGGARL